MPFNPSRTARSVALATFAAFTLPNAVVAAPLVEPSGGPSSLPLADAHITAKAQEWFHRLQSGEIDRSQLDTQLNAQLTDDIVRRETKTLTPLGDPASFVFVRTYELDGALEYDFLLQFKSTRLVELISFDSGGKIAGLGFELFGPAPR